MKELRTILCPVDFSGFSERAVRYTQVKRMFKTVIVFSVMISLMSCTQLLAHCDTLNGPVVSDARRALETGDVAPVLKWIKKEHEEELRAAFAKAEKVRRLNTDAKELADNSFFEALVRLHREGEGAPFTGLQAEALDPVIAGADDALENDSIDTLSKTLTAEIQSELHHLFEQAVDKKKTAERSVEDGREYVEAYVRFVHYVEALHQSSQFQSLHGRE